jgi:hydrogenase-4 component B
MTISTYLFAGTVFFYCLGALLSLINRKKASWTLWISNLAAGIGSLAGVCLGVRTLLTGMAWESTCGALLPGLEYSFRLDRLSGFFLLIICAIGFIVSIYSIGYEKEYLGRKSVGFLGSMYNLFLLSMVLVLSAANAFLFVVVWELMAIVSYFLVTFEHEERSVRRAGFVYIVMTHIGTLFILLAFFMLYRASGSLEFASFKGLNLTSEQKNWVFVLALIGFGIKAGIAPLHIWLPRAHPAAPSNVSALMSAVMVKTAVYMILRLVLDILGPGPVWWGCLVAGLGMLSAFIGIIYAMIDKDLKRVLAYSTVENVGIIFIALGVGFTAWSLGIISVAKLALGAALLHCLNHAIFKALLFMGAGSILQATHTKNIERLGGLLKKMPYTGMIFLVGSLAISSFPPFNGFISEWLIFQSLLSLGFSATGWLKVVGPVLAALLGLIAALAAATFVKAFGVSFLALPRSTQAKQAKEVGKPMLMAGGFMGVCALLLGVMPGPVLATITPIFNDSLGNQALDLNYLSVKSIAISDQASFGTISPGLIFCLLIIIVPLVLLLSRGIGGRTRVTVDETWNCGVALNSRMEYTATGLSNPLRKVFATCIRGGTDIKVNLYDPLNKLLFVFSDRIRAFQAGSIHAYLAYILVTLLVLLAFAR